MDGRFAWKTESRLDIQELRLPDWCPILIVCPNTVMSNWVNEFNTWAHFTVAVYHGAGREDALQGVGDGVTEVLVCPHSMMQGKCFPTLNNAKVNWKAVFVDEFHVFKNELATMATNLRALRDRHRCVIVGLTGTVMQNKHKDLWSLVDLVADGYFGSYQQFDHEFARPIKLARYDMWTSFSLNVLFTPVTFMWLISLLLFLLEHPTPLVMSLSWGM